MCGIAGIFDRHGDPAMTAQDVATMTATLVHRGPDDGHVATGAGWALGARRLAIQDVSLAGRQPMTRGDLTIAFNGEVYNFPDLRRDLGGHGYEFVSRCDTEVVLAAFDRWGTGAFSRFNGMFALAIVDARKRRAWLARDRWGKKPLFLARLGQRIAFGSELKAILAVAGHSLTLDRRAMAHYFRYQYVPGTESIFTEVEKLSAASWVELDLDGWSTTYGSFWSLPEYGDGAHAARPEEVLDVVRAAVKRRLIADVPVGAFLSGGTDSSLVVACMKEADADCRSFSIGFDDPRFDESRYALAVARYLRTNHTHRVLRQEEALRLITSLPETFDEPFADSSALPQLAVSRIAREQVTVALSGDGGDELFGGYLRYRARPYLASVAYVPSVLSAAAPAAYRLPRFGGRIALMAELAAASSPGAAYRELVSVWRTPELRRLMPDVDATDAFAENFDFGFGNLVERMMRCDARTYLIDDILQKVDRATMAVSLEGRNPLLDPEVVDIGFRSSSAAEAKPSEKPLLRATLALLLPKTLVSRPKMGFGVPMAEWIRRELRPAVEDLVLASHGTEYEQAVARKVCRDHLMGRRDAAHQVWSLLSLELWRRRWLAPSGAVRKPSGLPMTRVHSPR
jgi:asparagine synthase (glutamine-hydrolysing)